MFNSYILTNTQLYVNDRAIVPHRTIRNYHNIISRPDYIKPEIGECFELTYRRANSNYKNNLVKN
jgi:hypothetical protein